MTLDDIRHMFNRALFYACNRKKVMTTFFVLLFGGLLAVFFRGLAVTASHWVSMSLTILPIFLCAGILLSLGIVLIRVYHDEIKQRDVSISKVLSKSWELVVGSAYFTIPIILSYLLLWMLLGIFVLLSQVPGVGDFFSVVLSFGPFLLNLGTLVLIVLNVSLLFFMAPILAFKGLNRKLVTQTFVERLESDPFSNIYLFFLAVLPLFIVSALLVGAAVLTGSFCEQCDTPLHTVLLWFFNMVPFTACLAPFVVFFFNFAAEAHVRIHRMIREGDV